jgi:hypothetical protein
MKMAPSANLNIKATTAQCTHLPEGESGESAGRSTFTSFVFNPAPLVSIVFLAVCSLEPGVPMVRGELCAEPGAAGTSASAVEAWGMKASMSTPERFRSL